MTRRGNPILGRPGLDGAIVSETKEARTDVRRLTALLRAWPSPERRGVKAIDSPNSCGSYSVVEVRSASGVVFALLHFAYPLVAFVESLAFSDKRFVDRDELAALIEHEFHVYAADCYNERLTVTDELRPCLNLSAIKRERPRSVGNYIFNEWD